MGDKKGSLGNLLFYITKRVSADCPPGREDIFAEVFI